MESLHDKIGTYRKARRRHQAAIRAWVHGKQPLTSARIPHLETERRALRLAKALDARTKMPGPSQLRELFRLDVLSWFDTGYLYGRTKDRFRSRIYMNRLLAKLI